MFPRNKLPFFPVNFCINTKYGNEINISVPHFSIRSHRMTVEVLSAQLLSENT